MTAEKSRNIKVVTAFTAILFVVLAARLWQLQVIKGGEYKQLSFENRLRVEKIPAPRGIIYDRNGNALVKNSAYYFVHIQPDMVESADIKSISELIGVSPKEIEDRITAEMKPLDPIKLKEGLSFNEVAYLEARLSDFPGLAVGVEETRYYPYGEIGAHLVGYLGRLNPRQAREKEFKDVPRQSFVGQWGIEKKFDAMLRGEPGKRVIEVDALGRQLRLIEDVPPVKGDDVYLSIDINLQKAVAKEFEGRAGAFMAIRPSTGELLGLLSSPSFDPNLFSRGINYADWVTIESHEGYPMLNRALQSQYPPGSTFKIVTAAAALEEGGLDPERKFLCTGGIRRGRWTFGCWRRSGHGSVDLKRGIIESCDVYFYNTGELAGIDAIAHVARRLGLGRETGLGLVEEKLGLVPDKEWKQRTKEEPWYLGETYNASIGQGFVLATPAQLARMISAIASGGVLPELSLVRLSEPPEHMERVLAQETVKLIGDALAGVVNEMGGTAYGSRSRITSIAGKTGTSQVVANKALIKIEGEIPYIFRDHSWFVAYAPSETPEIALSVFVEHGGHGSSAAAPIAKKAIEIYVRSLERPEDTEGG